MRTFLVGISSSGRVERISSVIFIPLSSGEDHPVAIFYPLEAYSTALATSLRGFLHRFEGLQVDLEARLLIHLHRLA